MRAEAERSSGGTTRKVSPAKGLYVMSMVGKVISLGNVQAAGTGKINSRN
jgi:hypothetical protein